MSVIGGALLVHMPRLAMLVALSSVSCIYDFRGWKSL